MEDERVGLVVSAGGGPRAAVLAVWVVYDLSGILASVMPSDSRMLRAPIGEGN
jgi:hypothetical protein